MQDRTPARIRPNPYKLLAISGSARTSSTNTAMLDCFSHFSPAGVDLLVYHGLADLPVFSPDREGAATPSDVLKFIQAVDQADGIIISSPEYARSIPGGLKNAIDWLVSRNEIIEKPIVLAHASHRGDDMLASLRLVLATVSQRFNPDLFVRFPLMSKSPEEVHAILVSADNAKEIERFIKGFVAGIDRDGGALT